MFITMFLFFGGRGAFFYAEKIFNLSPTVTAIIGNTK